LISLNYSLFIQLLVFLAIVFFLQRFLFKPLLNIWQKREEVIVGNRQKAEELSQRLDNLIIQFATQIWAARRLAQEEQEKIRKQNSQEIEQMVQIIRTETNEMIQELREKIALEYKPALGRISEQAEKMGREIAEKILGRGIEG